MYIDVVPNRASPPAILLRESARINGKIKKRTLANLSALPAECIEPLRALLRGENLVTPSDAFDKISDQRHGGCEAIRVAMHKIGFPALLDSRRCRERDIVVAMVAMRILNPKSKLATSRLWPQYTLPADLGIADVDEKQLYAAMDWLLERQDRIETKLAARHLNNGGLALYDLSSSYFEGVTCPLAQRGYSRDGKHGTLQVNYGLMTDERGCPVAVSVYPGNTADSTTVASQLSKLRDQFKLNNITLVGDRGMISQKQINAIAALDGTAWITALRSGQIKDLVAKGAVQLGLFDDINLFELTHTDYPNERLIACKNHELAKRRALTREQLLKATETKLDKIKHSVDNGKLRGAANIGMRIGKVIGKYKVAKHFITNISDNSFAFSRNDDKIREEAALDGIYIVRTSLPQKACSAADTVHNYKKLAQVERAFRSIKTTDLAIRPIHHRTEDRVRAHIFLCVLAYYVQWHMMQALRPMLFADEMTDEQKAQRDPVSTARRSEAALRKASRKTLDDGSTVHSFRTLLCELDLIVRSTCRLRAPDHSAPTFEVTTSRSPPQQKAFDLLAAISLCPVP